MSSATTAMASAFTSGLCGAARAHPRRAGICARAGRIPPPAPRECAALSVNQSHKSLGCRVGRLPFDLLMKDRGKEPMIFDDPNLPGEMQTTITLKKVSCGTELNIVQEV